MNNIVTAFARAAVELGFRFEPTVTVELGDGTWVETLGLVRQFGSPVGTLLFSNGSDPSSEKRQALSELGYFSSALFPAYEEYKPDLFKATLDDWQFFGSDIDRPSWYTGKPWG